jgi:MFS family permease
MVRAGRWTGGRLERTLGGAERTHVIVILACVLALSGADTATVGASATELRKALGIGNTDIGLLVAVTSLVAAVASIPFGVIADRVRRTRALGISVLLWAVAMLWSATVPNFGRLLLARVFLGLVTASAGPIVASLIGDYFPSAERGRIYSYVLTGEMLGAGLGFAISGDIAALSWRLSFVFLAIPTFVLARYVFGLPEPARGGLAPLHPEGVAPQPAEDQTQETDAQRLARDSGVTADEDLVIGREAQSMNIVAATRYILRIRTNVILIIASACGYFYLSGVQTFGVEFAKQQYGVNQAVANFLLLLLGGAAVLGVIIAGRLSDRLLHRGFLSARITVTAVAAAAATVLFIPPLLGRQVRSALPWLLGAAFMLSAQNPPIDAARLDIMPPLLWGRAEGVRTALRTGCQALAPLMFGVLSDHLFGGGRAGLQWTFIVALAPLAANAVLLISAIRTYPGDVATAAASQALEVGPPEPPPSPSPGTLPDP